MVGQGGVFEVSGAGLCAGEEEFLLWVRAEVEGVESEFEGGVGLTLGGAIEAGGGEEGAVGGVEVDGAGQGSLIGGVEGLFGSGREDEEAEEEEAEEGGGEASGEEKVGAWRAL